MFAVRHLGAVNIEQGGSVQLPSSEMSRWSCLPSSRAKWEFRGTSFDVCLPLNLFDDRCDFAHE